MEDLVHAAVYGRVSSERQAEDLTIQSQVAALRQRVAADGLKLEQELCFLDEGYSGDTLLRPALERLRDVAWAGGIDRLYVHSPDRLARKYAYQVVLLEEFAKCRVEVVFLNHAGRSDSPEGELLLQMQGMFAEYERAKILERSRRGRRYAARQGKVSVLGHAPYGYRYIPKSEGGSDAQYEVILDQARLVREMFTWVGVEGLSLGQVAARLAERGVPSPTGKSRWNRATIRDMLLNPAYTGTARYGKTRRSPRKGRIRPPRGQPEVPRHEKVTQPAPLAEQDPIPVPALISQELFVVVGAQLEENARRQREQKQGAGFLLSGLLVCHRCGSAYCGRRIRRPRPYAHYRCLGTDKYRHGGEPLCDNESLNGPRVEAAVWSDVCALLQDPARVRRELQRRLERPPPDTVDVAHHRESVAKLKRRLARLIDAYENGYLDKTDFEPRVQRAKEHLVREEASLAHQQSELAGDAELRLLVGEFDRFAAQMRDGLAAADDATKRKLLRLLVKRIEVDTDEIRIVYKVQPLPFAHSPARGILQHCLDCPGKPAGLRLRSFPLTFASTATNGGPVP